MHNRDISFDIQEVLDEKGSVAGTLAVISINDTQA
jgi:hypothetical protein